MQNFKCVTSKKLFGYVWGLLMMSYCTYPTSGTRLLFMEVLLCIFAAPFVKPNTGDLGNVRMSHDHCCKCENTIKSRHREIHRSSVLDRWKQWRTDENPYCAGSPVRKKFLQGAPLWGLLCWKYYNRSCKSFSDPIKVQKFSRCL